jgi:energy-coupling factor transport system substrate-specific component
MQAKPRVNKRVLCSLLILLLIPGTILFGIYVLGDRAYYLISLLIIVLAMLPFFMAFEHRKPQARELIVIAVLSAIAVAGRAAFFMVPQFKPVAAIVILTAVCFGAESGFLVGAMSAFVSNFFFGQGPNTPWQMFCFGLLGFLAGILYQHGILKHSKISLCIFGGLSTLLIYGGIINFGTFLMSGMPLTMDALLATYAAGVPFDLIHAASTVIFLFVLSRPMIEKLERIKTKYGMME